MDFLKRRRIVLLLVVLSLGGLAGLYFYSLSAGPAEVPVGDLVSTPLGSLVTTSGLIRDPRPTSSTPQGLTFTHVEPEGSREVKVFVAPSAYASISNPGDLLPGAMVRVSGELQEFRGEKEVAVTRAADVAILRKAEENIVPLGYLARAPWAFEGMSIAVRGRIGGLVVLRGDAGPVGTGFDLSDGNYSINGVIFGWNWLGDPRGIRNGAAVMFTGEVSYYAQRSHWLMTSDVFSLELVKG
jgi:hypothetical protein